MSDNDMDYDEFIRVLDDPKIFDVAEADAIEKYVDGLRARVAELEQSDRDAQHDIERQIAAIAKLEAENRRLRGILDGDMGRQARRMGLYGEDQGGSGMNKWQPIETATAA